jgi:hypothetical protein
MTSLNEALTTLNLLLGVNSTIINPALSINTNTTLSTSIDLLTSIPNRRRSTSPTSIDKSDLTSINAIPYPIQTRPTLKLIATHIKIKPLAAK